MLLDMVDVLIIAAALVFIVECEVVVSFCIFVGVDAFWFGIGGFVVERGYI